MNDYKITVVIPTYNTGDFLINLIDSIKVQTFGFENIELLIVDDNSNDIKTLDLIKNYENSFKNCKAIFLDENHDFPGTARNEGLKIASSDYIIFADHDDTYEADAFERLYTEALENKADLVFSNYYKEFSDKKIKFETILNGENVTIADISQDKRLLKLSPSIWTKLFRVEFLKNNNICFLERMLGEDLFVFIFSLIKSSKTVYLDDFYSYNYNIRDSKEDKSTIHIRSKHIFESIIKGYFETSQLLVKLNKEEYFSDIFQNHFVYWITSLIDSNLSDKDKIELLKEIQPLFVKYLTENEDFGEKIYNPLIEPILSANYNKVIKKMKYIKLRRNLANKFKRF